MRFQRIAATGSKLACVALELVGGLLLLLLPGLVGAAQLFANLLGTVLLDLEGQILKKKIKRHQQVRHHAAGVTNRKEKKVVGAGRSTEGLKLPHVSKYPPSPNIANMQKNLSDSF